MTERSPFLSAGWGRYQTRGLSFANYDGSSLPREPMGARIGLGSAPSGECRFKLNSNKEKSRALALRTFSKSAEHFAMAQACRALPIVRRSAHATVRGAPGR